MTTEQEHLFVEMARMGVACGLGHPFEWFVNYVRTLPHWHPWETLEQREREAYEMFCAFLQASTGAPDHPWESITPENLDEEINLWYERERAAVKKS